MKARGRDDERAFAEIVATLNDVVREAPQVIDAWFTLGMQYPNRGDARKAIDYFRKGLALEPDYDLAVADLAAADRRLGDDDAALAGFERYLQIDPSDAYVHYQVGEIWLDRGDLAAAERVFRRALALDPQVAAATNARGDVAGAERQYLEALKGHPETYKAAFNLSRLYQRVGDREGEIQALRQSVESNPWFAEGHFFLARACLESEGNLAEAVRLARKGLELAPDSEFAALGHSVLADVFSRQGRAREADAEAVSCDGDHLLGPEIDVVVEVVPHAAARGQEDRAPRRGPAAW